MAQYSNIYCSNIHTYIQTNGHTFEFQFVIFKKASGLVCLQPYFMCQMEVTTSNVLGFSEIQYFPASLWIGAKHYRSSGILQKLARLVLKPWRRETTQVLLKFLQCKNYIILNTIVRRMGWETYVYGWGGWGLGKGNEWEHEVDSETRSSWLGIYLSQPPEAHLLLETHHPLGCFLGMMKCKKEWKEEVLLTSELWWPCMDFRGLWSFWIPIFIL